ncbi:MAG: hypothetical protein HXX08_00965 [Chloroflexi bacterium]|uniref:Uncharacterized protein n=1 Tax=Candidatus Chlorohelix allophototropha TaxID=3003348 RepID=A0A8T7M194_9CHLR|nr:hypothetical protein [Chloroflexota bacterium]WJW66318.1 hypothetical protein OZ401_002112 [Chloroflexota bacterium L227-S17]
MLVYSSPDRFFENCLEQCALRDSWQRKAPTLSEAKVAESLYRTLVRALNDLRSGADTVYARGKPSGEIDDSDAWERKWQAWASARATAFYSRAALVLLGEKGYLAYFLEILRTSDNLAFLGASNDLLQHSSGYYLSGAEEDLTRSQLADFWQQRGL